MFALHRVPDRAHSSSNADERVEERKVGGWWFAVFALMDHDPQGEAGQSSNTDPEGEVEETGDAPQGKDD